MDGKLDIMACPRWCCVLLLFFLAISDKATLLGVLSFCWFCVADDKINVVVFLVLPVCSVVCGVLAVA